MSDHICAKIGPLCLSTERLDNPNLGYVGVALFDVEAGDWYISPGEYIRLSGNDLLDLFNLFEGASSHPKTLGKVFIYKEEQ